MIGNDESPDIVQPSRQSDSALRIGQCVVRAQALMFMRALCVHLSSPGYRHKSQDIGRSASTQTRRSEMQDDQTTACPTTEPGILTHGSPHPSSQS